MKTRPTSVTVISWILIVAGGISLISTTATINNPMTRELMSKSLLSVPAQYAITYLGLLITIVSSIMMLKGYNLARFLYVIWGAKSHKVASPTAPELPRSREEGSSSLLSFFKPREEASPTALVVE
jgi:hypothetical protein